MAKWMRLALLVIGIGLVAGAALAQDQQPAGDQGGGVSIVVGVDVFERAGQAFDAGNFEQAITDYSLFILLNPTFSQAYFQRGVSYTQLNDYDKALADLTSSLTLPQPSPDFTVRAYSVRAFIYQELADLDAALKDLNAAVAASPEQADGYYWRGQFYLEQNQIDEALADFSKVIEYAPDTVDAYAYRGAIYLQREDYAAATADYTQLIELTPDDARVYFQRALAYIGQEQWAEALADLDEAIAIQDNVPELYLQRARVNSELGNTAPSAEDYMQYARLIQTTVNTDILLRPGESQVVEMEAGLLYGMGFEGQAGQTITLTVDARVPQTVDPLLILLRSNGDALVADDDSGGDYNARINSFTLPADGVYVVVVTHAGGGSDGALRVLLQVEQP
ncbi:MAG: tetratricopeptide repeat protein [Anaerolineae bacterium]|nr:tetratricopeptide repeat protein [Anaerolineae bacterium]